ncbi:MAG: hypothetical protein L3J57_15535 [Desulfuromusa sp.]|nr:hypothetical protein [Desulfuromusa sp.]
MILWVVVQIQRRQVFRRKKGDRRIILFALVLNLILAFSSLFYAVILILHLGFYGLAGYGLLKPEALDYTIVKIPLYFLTVNAAILVAWYKYVTGNRMVMWTPSSR